MIVRVRGGPFSTIVADPPWLFRDRRNPRGGTEKHYAALATKVIAQMNVGKLACERAHLYLWLVEAMAEDAYAVCRAWGFTPVQEVTWIKAAPQVRIFGPPRARMGLGWYFRHVSERCLFGVRGKLRLLRRDAIPQIFEWRGGRHSQKPEAFMQLVEQCSPPPRLELFARQKRSGWVSWGHEA